MNSIGIHALLLPLASTYLMLTHYDLTGGSSLSALSAIRIAWLWQSRGAAFCMDVSPSISVGAL
ncbi:hypothetical protein [Bradyrhizobium sp. McL0616]|uniref:hypothetical protein n=1 Tax=Bradyrhizobium sp. McL0616 TaxID=3415674 RepID=UPI003CF2FF62